MGTIWDRLKKIRIPDPNSPAKGTGSGFFRPARPLGDVGKLMSQSVVRAAADSPTPHPASPAGRYFPWQITLPKPGEGDGSFEFSFHRSGGLTQRESALLERAHTYFRLKMGAEGKIAGVLILPDGTLHAFVSGKHGGPHGGTQDGFLPRGRGTGVNRFNVTHIEGHSVQVLHRATLDVLKNTKVGEAALLLPKGPCGACDPNLPQMLPSGTRLFVVDPQETNIYQSSSGLTTQGMKFSRRGNLDRPKNLHFTVPKAKLRIKTIGIYAGYTAGAVALGVVGAWLRGRLERDIIEGQIRRMGPDIQKALDEKADQVLELVAARKTAFANVTVEIVTVTTFEAEPGGPHRFDTLPAVILKKVSVSVLDINKTDPERHEWTFPIKTNTTSMTFSFEIDCEVDM